MHERCHVSDMSKTAPPMTVSSRRRLHENHHVPDTIKEHVAELIRTSQQQVGPDPVVGEVVLQVDYQIIEHFSEHLYDSPNKAVEELVANSFDAFATEVRVFTPGPYTANRVIVWDNGESMDVEGLQQLWWIAKSPKLNGDRVEEREGRTRKIIGKFGIGKLASYSVGEVISHVCRHQGECYVVSIDYGQIEGTEGASPVSSLNPIRAPVFRLPKEHAFELVKDVFDTPSPSIDMMLNGDSWTFAIIEKLKMEDLPSGRLMWVLGNGMPLRPDFRIKVNDDEVQSKLNKQAVVDWDFGSKEVVDAIRSRWDDAVAKNGVSPIVEFSSSAELDPNAPTKEIPFVRFAHLGLVWGHVRLFDKTLLRYRSADHGRSHGFFLVVRGRLLNPDDEQLFLPDPSFQTFYKSQFVIHADDLDGKLLADRQRLRKDEPVVQELELLQKALAGIARTTVEARDNEQVISQSTRSILPVGSRTYYRDPLNALLLKAPIEDVSNFDPATVGVERKHLGENARISKVALKEGEFHVNTGHPYYSVLAKRAGQSRAAREFLRTFDLFAISERLLEGHLLDIGIPEKDVAEVVEWREGLFRQLANSYDRTPEIVAEMHRTSYIGNREFEKALHDIFADMGFSAEHDGRSGQKDVLVVATVGPESYKFIVEAKGSKNDVGNEAAKVGAAANHRDQIDAGHAVVVARRFAGFGSGRDDESAALYQECKSTRGVAIMEIDALEVVYLAITKFSYPLPLLRDVFTTLETPAQKLVRIRGTHEAGGRIRLLGPPEQDMAKTRGSGERRRGSLSINLPGRPLERGRHGFPRFSTPSCRPRHAGGGTDFDEHESGTCLSEAVTRFDSRTDREVVAGRGT